MTPIIKSQKVMRSFLSFFGFLLENDPHDHVEGLHEHTDVNKAPKKLEEVELVALGKNESWHSADEIE